MNQKTEIYENEDATKFLDYFIAYKKLSTKIETIKCIAALNPQITINQNLPQSPNSTAPEILDNQPTLTSLPQLMQEP